MIDRITQIIATECGWLNRTHATDDPDANLRLNDIDRTCLQVGIEDEFGVLIPDAELLNLHSVNDILATVQRLTKETARV